MFLINYGPADAVGAVSHQEVVKFKNLQFKNHIYQLFEKNQKKIIFKKIAHLFLWSNVVGWLLVVLRSSDADDEQEIFLGDFVCWFFFLPPLNKN